MSGRTPTIYRILMLSITQNFRPAAILWLSCLFVSFPNLADESPDEIALQSGYGYLLIRLSEKQGGRVSRFEMTNIETGDVIKTTSRMYKSAGVDTWMCLVAVPEGRYFWSEYGRFSKHHRISDFVPPELFRQGAPTSVSDIFEIVPGVINYVGDWVMRIALMEVRGHRMLEADTTFNEKTLELLFDRYPEHANRYEIYVSLMGKYAISRKDYRRIVEEHANSPIE